MGFLIPECDIDLKRSTMRRLLTACSIATPLALIGCASGVLSESFDSVSERDLSGVAQPGDRSKLKPVEYIARDMMGKENAADNLGYLNLKPEERKLLDAKDVESP